MSRIGAIAAVVGSCVLGASNPAQSADIDFSPFVGAEVALPDDSGLSNSSGIDTAG